MTNYKSTRLLVETINREVEVVRKILMAQSSEPTMSAVETMNDLRGLIDQLAAKADRPTVDDVAGMAPADFVATMKPLVAAYHRSLMAADVLAPCLCEDLQADACVVVVLGAAKTVVRTAHDRNRPEAAIAVEAILAALDSGTRQVAADGAAEAERIGSLAVVAAPVDPRCSRCGRTESPTCCAEAAAAPKEPA